MCTNMYDDGGGRRLSTTRHQRLWNYEQLWLSFTLLLLLLLPVTISYQEREEELFIFLPLGQCQLMLLLLFMLVSSVRQKVSKNPRWEQLKLARRREKRKRKYGTNGRTIFGGALAFSSSKSFIIDELDFESFFSFCFPFNGKRELSFCYLLLIIEKCSNNNNLTTTKVRRRGNLVSGLLFFLPFFFSL